MALKQLILKSDRWLTRSEVDVKCQRRRGWGRDRGARAVTGALTQIFEEGQRQDDPDGHKYHQVVPVQVPFAAGEVRRVRAGSLTRVGVKVKSRTHPEFPSNARKVRMTSGSSYLTMNR